MAGGIGITPLRALFETMPAEPGDLTLLYRANAAQDLVFRDELEAIARNAAPGCTTSSDRRAARPIHCCRSG